MKSAAAVHASHGEELERTRLTAQLYLSFKPIHLRFLPGRVALRHKYFAPRQPHRPLPAAHIFAHRGLGHRILRLFGS
jgi:hypothetical protein